MKPILPDESPRELECKFLYHLEEIVRLGPMPSETPDVTAQYKQTAKNYRATLERLFGKDKVELGVRRFYRWKIQTRGVGGWADVKISYDNGESYKVEIFETEEEAQEEVKSLSSCSQFRSELEDTSWRVVRDYVPQDVDIY